MTPRRQVEIPATRSSSSVGRMTRGHRMQCLLPLFAGIMMAVVSGPAGAEAGLDGKAVKKMIKDQLAQAYLEGNPAISPTRRFPACEGAVAIDPLFGGWNTVAVRCDVDGGWKFAIRTNLSTTPDPVPVSEFGRKRHTGGPISKMAASAKNADMGGSDQIDVVALTRSLSRGDVILPSDLVLMAVPARNVSGVFFAAEDVVGRRMKGALSAHRPLQSRHLQPSFMIEEESEVLIVSRAGGISVDMVGYALENGQFGDWIKVQNAGSGKTIMAKVVDEKKVAVMAKNS